MRQLFGLVAIFAGVALALVGGFAALALWGLMATYPDDVPNTLLQNLSPLVLLVPGVGGGAALFWVGWKSLRRPDPH